MDKGKRKQVQFSAIYLLIALAGVFLFQQLIFRPLVVRWSEVPYSQFLQELEAGNIEEVTLGGERIFYTCCTVPEGDEPGQVYNAVPVEDPDLIERLLEAARTRSFFFIDSSSFLMVIVAIQTYLLKALIALLSM